MQKVSVCGFHKFLGTTTCNVLKKKIKTGRLEQGCLNKFNICTISLKRQKNNTFEIINKCTFTETFNVQDHIPSLAGLKNDGLSDAIASTPMALACLA